MLSAHDVWSRDFTTTLFQRGYAQREVDSFLDLVVQTLEHYEAGGTPGQAPLAADDVAGPSTRVASSVAADPETALVDGPWPRPTAVTRRH